MFVRMYVLPELPQLYQGWISTAGRFLGVIWTVFVYLSHLSWVTRISDPEISGKVWVKEHFSHGSTSLSDFLTEFCQVHQGFTETRGGTSSHIMGFASRDFFFKWKGDTIPKGPQTVALENLWLAQILWLTIASQKIPYRPVMVWTVSPSFFLCFYQGRLKIFDICVEVFMQQYLQESVSFWIWLPVPQEVFPDFVFWPQPSTTQTLTPPPAGSGRELKA